MSLSQEIPATSRASPESPKNTVYKWNDEMNRITTYSAGALALQIFAEQTTIPVPLVRRVTYDPEIHSNEIAIEFIPGEQLGAVWPRLSRFGRLRVALTLRSYVRQLRHIRTDRSHIPGPLARPGEGGMIGSSPMYNEMVHESSCRCGYRLRERRIWWDGVRLFRWCVGGTYRGQDEWFRRVEPVLLGIYRDDVNLACCFFLLCRGGILTVTSNFPWSNQRESHSQIPDISDTDGELWVWVGTRRS